MKNNETNFITKLQKFDDLESLSEYDIVKEVLLKFKDFFGATNVVWKISEIDNDIYSLNENIDGILYEIEYDHKNNTYLRIYNPDKSISSEAKEIINVIIKSLISIVLLKRQILDSEYNRHLDSTFNILNKDAFNEKVVTLDKCSNVGVCYIDANNLKGLNDMYGHEEGDKLLREIASCMKRTFKFSESFRIGGDEFIIISTDVNEEEFYKKVRNVKLLLEETGYSASFGAIYSKEETDISKQILIAEKLMYEDKKEYYKTNYNERSRFSQK